jgi:carbamoyltransferase
MGLAPYGDPTIVYNELERFYPKFQNGKLIQPHEFGDVCVYNENGGLQWHFDDADHINALLKKYKREDLASAAQKILEEQMMEIVFPWMIKEKTENLACSGGVFLNVKLNQRIWESKKVKNHHIYPNPGDGGLAVGAALYAHHAMNPGAEISGINNLYFGPSFSNDEIEKVLSLDNLEYQRIDDPPALAAQLLASGKIVAWFQGRMESGPRSLGNRSILMSANRPENKDIINARVKFREAFRPFCPSLIYEKKDDYLENPREENFMITSFTVTEGKRNKVPAVVHKDNTLRPQTVKREANEKYWKLISKFGDLTGEHLVLNTSFNVMGEPIICQPRQAVRCFYDSGIDALVIGDFLLKKGT